MDEAKCAYAGETIKQVHHSLQAAWLEGELVIHPVPVTCVLGRWQEPGAQPPQRGGLGSSLPSWSEG